jgi:Putative phage tail protein
MATLILNAVGAAVGGPIGAAIGSTIGNLIDQRLLAPKGRQGPRLGDLSFQSSTYGARIPKLFGASRVAGTVIWATDLKESRTRASTGKGRPKQTQYSYSASFAVALSSRPVRRIGRIWADGKLLRGAAGDLKVTTGFRLHTGAEGQGVDPLIAATHGVGATPAYQGIAYCVFEDLHLADYGNRIPALTFEVLADDGDVSLGTIITALAPAAQVDCPTRVAGFAANGDSVRATLDVIARGVRLFVSDDGQALAVREHAVQGPLIRDVDLGAHAEPGAKSSRLTRDRSSALRDASRTALRFYDPAREYQIGLQRGRRLGRAGREVTLDWPATLSANQAATLVERILLDQVTSAETVDLALPWRYLDVLPGRTLVVPGLSGRWYVETVALDAFVVRATVRRVPVSLPVATSAEPGLSVREKDQQHGPTLLRIVDLPFSKEGVATRPLVYAIGAGAMPGWNSAAVLFSTDDGALWTEIGATAQPGSIGTATSTLGASQTCAVDSRSALVVSFPHEAMALQSTSRAGLLAGKNLAMVGAELIQFETAEQIAPTQYRLTGLLRGRFGTDRAVGGHSANEPFILIDEDVMLPLPVVRGDASVRVMASGVGDPVPVEASLLKPGAALMPLSPVRLVAEKRPNGDVRLSWTRRSRDGWRWLDGVDAPLGEEQEAYAIDVRPNVGVPRVVSTSQSEWTYAAADRAVDAGATSVSCDIRQIGTFGTSHSATLSFSL